MKKSKGFDKENYLIQLENETSIPYILLWELLPREPHFKLLWELPPGEPHFRRQIFRIKDLATVSSEEWDEVRGKSQDLLIFLTYSKEVNGAVILGYLEQVRGKSEWYAHWLYEKYRMEQIRENCVRIVQILRTRKAEYIQRIGLQEDQLTPADWEHICDFPIKEVVEEKPELQHITSETLKESLTITTNENKGDYTITIGDVSKSFCIDQPLRASQLKEYFHLDSLLFKTVLTALIQSGRLLFYVQRVFPEEFVHGDNIRKDLVFSSSSLPERVVYLKPLLKHDHFALLFEISELGISKEDREIWYEEDIPHVLYSLGIHLEVPYGLGFYGDEEEILDKECYSFYTIIGIPYLKVSNGQVISLSLEGLGLESFPHQILEFSKLEGLFLEKNKITSIPEEITLLKNLRNLDITNNHLIDLSRKIVKFFTDLELRKTSEFGGVNYDSEYINLEIPPLEKQFLVESRIPVDRIVIKDDRISEITHPSPDMDKLRVLPKSIKYLTELQWLDLSGNLLVELPEEIGFLSNLKSLKIGRNLLTSLPSTIGNLHSLQELDASDNHLETLPDSIGSLKNLQTLNLGEGKWKWFGCDCDYSYRDDELFESLLLQFAEISIYELSTYLNPHRNHLTSLPNSIGNLDNLRKLFLSGNWLKTLPSTIGNLGELETLDLRCNILETLPKTIKNLHNLKDLRIQSPISLLSSTDIPSLNIVKD